MTIRVAVNHITHYHFDRPVALTPHVFRLRPAVHSRTPIEAYSFKIAPENHFINWQQDPFGNYQARVVFPEKVNELTVEVDVIADMTVINPFDFFVEEYAEHYPFEYNPQVLKELHPYMEITDSGPLLRKYVQGIDQSKKEINDFLVDLNKNLEKDINYTVRMEPGIQTCEETLHKALGSCRDSGWLMVQILRHLGLAARFVSGYLIQLTPDVKSLDGPAGPAQAFKPGRPVLEAVYDLMERIHRDFTYDPGFTTLSTPLGEVLRHRRGVCQDFAHLAIGCLRAQGVPARYVSGYVETLPPPGTERLVGADASHAWFAVYLPDSGWLDFDPTNNQMPMDRHITVGWGRDYADVSPVKGVVFGGRKHEISVSVDVQNLSA